MLYVVPASSAWKVLLLNIHKQNLWTLWLCFRSHIFTMKRWNKVTVHSLFIIKFLTRCKVLPLCPTNHSFNVSLYSRHYLKITIKGKTTTTTARTTVIQSHYFMLIQSIALSYAKTHNPQINEGICAWTREILVQFWRAVKTSGMT